MSEDWEYEDERSRERQERNRRPDMQTGFFDSIYDDEIEEVVVQFSPVEEQ